MIGFHFSMALGQCRVWLSVEVYPREHCGLGGERFRALAFSVASQIVMKNFHCLDDFYKNKKKKILPTQPLTDDSVR